MHSLDFNVDFVLACGDVFLYRGVFINEVFSYTIVDETCSASDVVLCNNLRNNTNCGDKHDNKTHLQK